MGNYMYEFNWSGLNLPDYVKEYEYSWTRYKLARLHQRINYEYSCTSFKEYEYSWTRYKLARLHQRINYAWTSYKLARLRQRIIMNIPGQAINLPSPLALLS